LIWANADTYDVVGIRRGQTEATLTGRKLHEAGDNGHAQSAGKGQSLGSNSSHIHKYKVVFTAPLVILRVEVASFLNRRSSSIRHAIWLN
jgi:hypothetical protein